VSRDTGPAAEVELDDERSPKRGVCLAEFSGRRVEETDDTEVSGGMELAGHHPGGGTCTCG
jgi:hypothetical protein